MELSDFKTVEELAPVMKTLIGSTADISSTIYNVKLYGATGDGSTNDQAAIQACVDATPDESAIYFPEGTYIVESTITIAGMDHVWIYGPGKVKSDNSHPVFTIDDTAGRSTESIYFKDLFIVGDGSTSTGILVNHTNGNGVREIRIIDCEIKLCLKGIHTSNDAGTHYIIVDSCRFTADDLANSIGVHLESPDNKIINNTIRGWDEGIVVDGASTLIRGNHIFRLPSASHDTCIAVRRAASSSTYGLTIVGNYIDGDPDDAAIVLDSQGIRGVVITGNYFRIIHDGGPFIAWEHTDGGTYNIENATIIGNFFYGVDDTKTNCITFSDTVTSASDHFHLHSNTWFQADPYSTRDDVIQTITYGANITPNPMLGRHAKITLTGDLTIGQAASANIGGIANDMTFEILQDGTGGWDVTWNGAYLSGWSDTGNAADARRVIGFKWDGTNWIHKTLTPYY